LRVWAGVPVAIVVAVGVAVGVAAGDFPSRAVIGELRAASVQKDQLEQGTAVDTGPFVVTIERARVLDELPGIAESDDAVRVVALVVTAEANGARTLSGAMLADSVALQGVDGLVGETHAVAAAGDGPGGNDDAPVPAPNVVVMADGSRLDALQPGLEYEVAMVWEQATEFPEPTELDVVVMGRTYRESSLDRSMEWLDRRDVAAGRVPVTPVDGAGGDDG
jgi:hypothetical protein